MVAAIGHEIDVTIADLVADAGLTPSEAAELATPIATNWPPPTAAASQLELVQHQLDWSHA